MTKDMFRLENHKSFDDFLKGLANFLKALVASLKYWIDFLEGLADFLKGGLSGEACHHSQVGGPHKIQGRLG